MLRDLLHNLFRGLLIYHDVLFAFTAIAFLTFWARTRFWLPKRAHILAAIGLTVDFWSTVHAAADSPVAKMSPAAKFLFALILPTIIYFFFVFYGGQFYAFKNRFKKVSRCPHCKLPINYVSIGTDAHELTQVSCPHCGQLLS
ncbi:MAG: hypothetical protein ACRD4R_02275 [Candidatus Acidiferrales bacterium]